MDKREANTDTTYCTSKKCIDKCWRHESNWNFDVCKNYWFMEFCKEKTDKGAVEDEM